MLTESRRFIASLCVVALSGIPSARAADTTEPFDVGASDVDFYVGFDGVGQPSGEKALSNEIMLGYGIVDRLSASIGTVLESNEQLADGAVYGGPLFPTR